MDARTVGKELHRSLMGFFSGKDEEVERAPAIVSETEGEGNRSALVERPFTYLLVPADSFIYC